MAKPSKKKLAEALLEIHGQTYAEEAGIKLGQGGPSPLFRTLCLSLLLSARISADIAVRAARAVADEGWTTPQKLADSTWAQRAKALNEAGYARYDERTSTMLGETADMLLDRYGGDLRKLREEAGRDPGEERKLLKRFKGMGDVGADIFCREVQVVWGELYPFADRRVLDAAQEIGLGKDAKALASQVSRGDFPRLTAALVRAKLAHDSDVVRERAGGA